MLRTHQSSIDIPCKCVVFKMVIPPERLIGNIGLQFEVTA